VLHGRSSETQRAYGAGIERFRREVAGKPIATVTVGDVQGFADSLLTLAVRSQARHLSSVKSLLSYDHRIGYLGFNVGAVVRLPKIKADLAERILPEEAVLRMIDRVPNHRNRTIVRLFYAACVRLSELAGLSGRDLMAREHGDGQVTVFGKGGKTRAVLLNPGTFVELVAICAAADEPLVKARTGGRLTTRQIERIVKTAALQAGLSARVSPHWFRHCHASHALDRGAKAHVVQATLGHASPATTSAYSHAKPSESSAKALAV
jgi:integrase/recombinase XerD